MEQIPLMLLLFAVGIVAGILNVMAGGRLGHHPSHAHLPRAGQPLSPTGPTGLAVFIQCIATMISFRREKYSDWKTSMRLAACALPGGPQGHRGRQDEQPLFQKVLGLFILVMVATVLIPRFGKNGIRRPGNRRADGPSIPSCSGSALSGAFTRWASVFS